MLEDQFTELIDPLVRGGGATLEDGEEFLEPPLVVLRYYLFAINWLPVVGEAQQRRGDRSTTDRYQTNQAAVNLDY